ncbi:hypothetical protein ACP4OV_022394 [Aristida adscensionis]
MASSSSAAKKARMAPADDVPWEEDQETIMNFSIDDPDVLECQICAMPYEAEVYMCKNGHGACASCCIRSGRKCGSCAEPIGDMRNRHLEAVLAAMVTPCKYRRYGCGERVRYTDKRRHEEACLRAPFHCPFAGCTYRSPRLYGHVQDGHAPAAEAFCEVIYDWGMTVKLRKSEPFIVLVQHRWERVFVLLNGGDVLGGRSLSLLSLGPEDMGLKYRMEVSGGEPGAPTLSAAGVVPCAHQVLGFKAKGFLFVPDAYWGASGTVKFSLRF